MNPDPFTLDRTVSTPVLIGVVVLYLASIAFAIYLYARVARKAGYSPWTALWLLVPVVGFVVILMFVFSEWPIERDLKELRSQLQHTDAGRARFGSPSAFGSGLSGPAPAPFGTPPAGYGPAGGPPGGYGTPGSGAPGYGAPGTGPRPPIEIDPFNAPPTQRP